MSVFIFILGFFFGALTPVYKKLIDNAVERLLPSPTGDAQRNAAQRESWLE